MLAFFLAAVLLLFVTSFADARFSVRQGPPPSNLKMVEYALSFTCVSINGVNHAEAQSQSLNTNINNESDGPSFEINNQGDPSVRAIWLSELVATQGDGWAEKGNITFAEGSTLFFASPGITGIQLGNYSNLNYGAITYNITGGTGMFEGSHGAMVDTFVATQPNNASAPFTINAWGLVWLAQ
eukprot:TRINITY_DN13984_c0_g1_i2.p1 TRINITY_DN13984_c0_g1~~TRINITY_DN13984_c0_g1_i2.p1  ORF type:complete len:202 (-),score=37.05 TRINITY_DN13984_c0_g1_i2:127-675(-)